MSRAARCCTRNLHLVMPLHADICVMCRELGFDNLNPSIWHKIANANYEISNGTKSQYIPTTATARTWSRVAHLEENPSRYPQFA